MGEPGRRAVYFGTLAQQLGLKPPRFLPAWITPLFGSVGGGDARSLRLSQSQAENFLGVAVPERLRRLPAMLAQMKQA